MSRYKMSTLNYRCFLLFIIVAVFVQVSIAHDANRLLAWPVEEDVTQMKANVSLQAHEVRKGKIAISQDILPATDSTEGQRVQIAPSTGDTLSINLFNDVKYDVKIDSVKHHADGMMIINGKLSDHNKKTVVMTIGAKGYLITVHDVNKSRLYRARGNSKDGSGSVTEIDLKKMPPVIR
jgi:hypothetical protein